ncbi:MAG: DUF1016 N-terminal domain-containing protein [Chlorobiaceae bacterium]
MKKTESNKAAGQLDFNQLVAAIRYADTELSAQASRAVNVSLTLRNWLIGYYIAEYELNGADRAVYGEKVLSELSLRLNDISNCNRRQLYRYLRFYRLYPQIVATLSPQFRKLFPYGRKVETEYALAGMDNHLFISKYLLELPTKEEMQRFMETQIKKLAGIE